MKNQKKRPPAITPQTLFYSTEHDQYVNHKMQTFIARQINKFVEQNKSQMLYQSNNSQSSNQSLLNSKNFVKKQLNFMFKIIDNLKRINTQAQTQVQQLSEQIQKYKQYIHQHKKQCNMIKAQHLQKYLQEKQKNKTISRDKKLKIGPKQLFKNVRQTKKRTDIQTENMFELVQNVISPFQLENVNPNIKIHDNQRKDKQIEQRSKSNDSNKYNIINQHNKKFETLNEQMKNNSIQQLKQSLAKLKKENISILKKNSLLQQKLKQTEESLKRQSQYKQYKYNALQDQFGKKKTQYEFKLEALRNKLREFQIKKSPIKEYPQGYYSINRPQNKEQLSDSSQSQSCSSVNRQLEKSIIIRNYQEQNDILRNQLIKQLDKNGQLRNQRVKSIQKIKLLQKEIQQLKNRLSQFNENNEYQKNNSILMNKSFKKNKQSIYFVEDTLKKDQNDQQKRKNYQIDWCIKSILKLLGRKQEQTKQIQLVEQLNFILQFIQYIKNKINQLERQIQQLKNSNKILKNNKNSLKEQNQILSVIKQNQSNLQNQEQKSAEKAFRHISIKLNNQSKNYQQYTNQIDISYKDHFVYQQKLINIQKQQIQDLKQIQKDLEAKLNERNLKCNQKEQNQKLKSNKKIYYKSNKQKSNKKNQQDNQNQNICNRPHLDDNYDFKKLKNKVAQFHDMAMLEFELFEKHIQKNIKKLNEKQNSIKRESKYESNKKSKKSMNQDYDDNKNLQDEKINNLNQEYQESSQDENIQIGNCFNEIIMNRIDEYRTKFNLNFESQIYEKIKQNNVKNKKSVSKQPKLQEKSKKKQRNHCLNSELKSYNPRHKDSQVKSALFNVDAESESVCSDDLRTSTHLIMNQQQLQIKPIVYKNYVQKANSKSPRQNK